MFSVQFLQELFFLTLDVYQIKSKYQKRIDLILGEKMFEFIGDILKRFINTEDLQNKLTFSSEILSNNDFNNFSDNINYVQLDDPDYYFYYTILKLFNKTNYFVFKKNNLRKVESNLKEFIQKVFSYHQNPGMITMRIELIKLYEIHLMEKENHLITFFTEKNKTKK